MIVATAPNPMRARAGPTPRIPAANDATPRPRTATPAPVRATDEPDTSMATSRRAAIGFTRLDRTAGHRAETTVMTVPTTKAVITVDGAITMEPPGTSRPTALSRARRPNDISTPTPRPTAEATTPDRDRLEHHRAHDLGPAGADGPQHGHVPRPLGDDDGEGVVDDEHPDEQGDVGEGQEEGVEEAQVLLEVGLAVGGVGRAGDDLEPRRVRRASAAMRADRASAETDPSEATSTLS